MKKNVLLGFVIVAGFLWGSCSSPTAVQKKSEIFSDSAEKLTVKILNEKKFPGNLGDIAIARKVGWTLISSIPDIETGGKHLLSLLDDDGDFRFQVPLTSAVRNLDISEDGSWAVTQHYEEGLKLWNSKGEVIFKTEANCRPHIINSRSQVLCIHDDDTKPTVAFEVFSSEGKRVLDFPVKQDLLAVKLSEDEKWMAIALVGGRVFVFDEQFHPTKEYRVPGEVFDIAISSGAIPKVGVVSMLQGVGQSVSIFGLDGVSPGEVKVDQHKIGRAHV